ncbi:bile salt-activated lipase-like isoform X1 [Kryptolebias marmoratus]|uniref:Carboxylic ester hydrolase n=1 Tax=Kryptolebias marmoratus TaxID=37003 RepID=A0A3Q3F433_KRYMA|nr:bile salt-activated lipase-like isoform X1 [Kryptolebias marmoratus]XP_024866434.1 bile salt-activated lipase-like isoform X1 [Kryptolebias marmoratus]
MMMLLLLVLLGIGLNSASAAKLGVVQTEGGLVEGQSFRMGLFRTVEVFKGVPFADVPAKWEKPKPHPGWSGVLKATKYRDRCLQVTLLQTKTRGSEDCLYLNIFVPHGHSVSTNLPVMVYLFGGAFLLGSSNDLAILGDSLYDGKQMADRGGVIVVTVNYRVGTMGFLSTGDSRLPGNYGLWDQHAAISWVRRNIRGFGGNSDNLTVFGQSAGAASVSFQMLSPYSKGLFRRAITQGGVALSPWALQKNPMALTKKIARKVGCWRTDEDEMLACLKMSDPVGLTMAGKIDIMLILGKGVVMDMLELAPVVDGDFIPDEPSNLFHNAAQFDYLAGVNSMDGHIFAGVDVPSINSKTANTTAVQVEGLLAGLTKAKGNAAVPSAFGVYSVHWGLAPEPAIVKKTVADIETDFLFLVPTQVALQLHANNASGASTYSYLFNMKTRIPGFPRWVEAEHAEDLQYLFGKPFSTPLAYFSRHRDLSGYMIAYWTNFAKTGDPSRGGSRVPVPWPLFTKNHRPYLIINHAMSKSSVDSDLRSYYVNYWTETYSRLPAAKTAAEEEL